MSVALVLLLLCLSNAKFDWKHQLHKIEDKVKEVTKEAVQEVKQAEQSAEDLSKKIKDKIGDKMFDDIMNAVDKIENKVEDKLNEIKDKVPTSQIEEERQKIFKKVSEQTSNAVTTSVRKVLEEHLFKTIFGQNQQMQESYNYRQDSNVPIVLRPPTPDAEGGRIGGGDHDWSWMRESRSQIMQLLDQFPQLREDYENNLKKIIEMVEQKKSKEEIRDAVRQMVEDIKSKIPQNEETTQLISQIEQRASQAQAAVHFDLEAFKTEIRKTLDEMKNRFNEATEEEKQQISTYLLATNERAEALLKRVQNQAITERVIKRMRDNVTQSLETSEQNYEEIMNELNDKVSKIEEAQLAHVSDDSIELRSPYGLKPRQQYTFSVEDLMVGERADIDFFEFQSMEPDFPTSILSEDNEGYVFVTPDSVTGVAPHFTGEFKYKTSLKYTSFRNGDDPKIIDTSFTLLVGEKYNKQPTKFNYVLIYVILSLGLIAFLLIMYQCVVKFRRRKVISFEEMTDSSFQQPPRKVEHARTSDLENTNDDSQ